MVHMEPDDQLIKAPDPVDKVLPEVPGLAARLDLLTKASVVASVAAYGAGFIVSVLNYSWQGISPLTIQHQTYLSAGISFFVLAGLGTWVGITFRKPLRHFNDARLPRSGTAATGGCYCGLPRRKILPLELQDHVGHFDRCLLSGCGSCRFHFDETGVAFRCLAALHIDNDIAVRGYYLSKNADVDGRRSAAIAAHLHVAGARTNR
jgi:hypothetical protein